MLLKNLCIKKIIERLDLKKDIYKLTLEIPKTVFWQIVAQRRAFFWCEILKQPYYESDPDSLYSDIEWSDFDFEFDTDNIDLFLFIITFKDWYYLYSKEELCVRFRYCTYNSINICWSCYFKCTQQLNPVMIEEHYPVRSEYLYQYVRDMDSWCQTCLKEPLFRVYTSKECYKLTHSYANFIQRPMFDL